MKIRIVLESAPPRWVVGDRPRLPPHARGLDDRITVILTDSARFAVDDVDPLVVAAFACPFCLERPTSTLFSLEEPQGSAVLCRCEECHASWVVAVNTAQALRLAIAPPIGLDLDAA